MNRRIGLFIVLLMLFVFIGSVSACSIDGSDDAINMVSNNSSIQNQNIINGLDVSGVLLNGLNSVDNNINIENTDNFNTVDTSNTSNSSSSDTFDTSVVIASKMIYIQDASYYNTSDLNSVIQELLNNAAEGATVKFLGLNYNDLYLTILKPMNIICNGTTITSTGGNPIFRISSSGVKISGFKLNSKGNTIYLKDVSDVTITKNSFNSYNGIVVRNSNNVNINNNNISVSSKALDLSESEGVSVFKNIISNKVSRGDIGIKLINDVGINITSNKISGFGAGISSGTNVTNVIIKLNRITDCDTGIDLNSGVYMSIINNTISKNGNGIVLNGKSDNLLMKSNYVGENLDDGFRIDSGYDFSSNKGLNVYANYFVDNGGRDIKSDSGPVTLGRNVANNVCPYVGMLKYKVLIKKNGKNYEVSLYDKEGTSSELPDFTATIYSSDYHRSFTVNFKNGKATFSNEFDGESVVAKIASNVFRGDLDTALKNSGNSKLIEVAYDYFEQQSTTEPVEENTEPMNYNYVDTTDYSNSSGSASGNSYVSSGDAASSGAGASGTSSASSSASSASSSAVVKSLEVDDEVFRVAGVGGLIVLIIFVVGLYYSRDIYELLKE